MDQPKVERMLRLMKMMSGNTNYTVEELADRLGMSYRSVYRYIDTFKASGFVVEKIQKNIYKISKIPRSYVDMKNLIYFSEEEAYLVNELINGLHPTNQLKTELKQKLSAIYNCTSIANYVHSENAASNIHELENAVRDKKKVILKSYESANSQDISDRFVEPFEFTTNCIDIWGYDLEKKECRVFKISRIGDVVVLNDDWSNEDKHQKSKTDCFRMSSFSQTPVKLELSLRAKNLLLEEYPLANADLREENGRWLLETMISDMAGVGRFVLGLMHEIKVIDSPELDTYINNYIDEHICKH